jgi:TonB family protein
MQPVLLSLLAHGVIAGALVMAIGWERGITTPGSAIWIHTVDGGGQTEGPMAPRSPGAPIHSPRPRPSSSSTEATAPPTDLRDTDAQTRIGDGVGHGGSGGSGTSSGDGNGGSGGTGGAGNPVLAEIRRRIDQAKRYPEQARLMHQEGRVGVRFRIHPGGVPTDIHVVQSSGVPILDQAALRAVRHSAPLPDYSPPIRIPITFHRH